MDVERRLVHFSRQVEASTATLFGARTPSLGSLDSSLGPQHRVKIALSLYKVQQSIYLLDFQRIEVT
jgi:hypothetical protein